MGQSQPSQRSVCVLPPGNRLLFFRFSFSHEKICLSNIAFVAKSWGGVGVGVRGEKPKETHRSAERCDFFSVIYPQG